MKIRVMALIWILLPTAIFAWVAVVLFALTIAKDAEGRAFRIQQAQETQDKNASAARLRAIVEDTVLQRAALEQPFALDIISMVNTIERVGTIVGFPVEVSSAIPENVLPSNVSGTTGVGATGFVVEASGTFSQVMRVVELLETLPVPSTVGRVELESVQSTKETVAGQWHMSAYVRIFAIEEKGKAL